MTARRLRLLVPVDGSENSRAATDVAIELAESLAARIVVCYVINLTKAQLTGGEAQLSPHSLNEFEAKAERIVSDALAHIGLRVAASSRMRAVSPSTRSHSSRTSFNPNSL